MASSSPDSPSSSGSAAAPSADSPSAEPAPAPRYERRAFTPMPSRVLGWILIAVAVANFVDIGIRGRDHASLIAAAALLLGCGVVYVLCLRPGIVAGDDAVHMRNPLRDVRVPWTALETADVTDALRLHAGGRKYRSWAHQESSRARARARMRKPRTDLPENVAAEIAGKTRSEYIAEQLCEMSAERSGGGQASGAEVTWQWPAVIAVVVPAVLLVVAILV